MLVATSRIIELRIAQKHKSGRDGDVQREPLYPFMVAQHTLIFFAIIFEVYLLERTFSISQAVFSVALLLFASLGRWWVIRTLKENWNVQIVQPRTIVTTGPYQYIRHPNYTIVIIEIIGLTLFHSAWFSCVIFTISNAIILTIRIRSEEKLLLATENYRAHFLKLKRFIPGVI